MSRFDPTPDGASNGDDESTFDFKLVLLYGAARSRKLIAATTVVGAVIGLFIAASMPNTYTSTMSMTLYSGLRERQNVESGVGIENDSKWGPGVEDELELLADPAIYERVAARLGPAYVLEVPDPGDAGGGLLHSLQSVLFGLRAEDPAKLTADNPLAVRKAGRHLLTRTQLVPVRRSAVIKVSHTAYTPERARRICEALSEALQERHREQYQAERHYQRQIVERESAFEAFKVAERLYREHRAECGFIDIERQKETLFMALGRIDQELAHAATRRAEAGAEAGALRASLGHVAEFITLPVELVPSPEFAEWQRRLYELDAELVLLDGKVGAKAAIERERESLRTRIASVEARLSELAPLVPGQAEGAKRVPNAERYRLEARIAELEAEQAGLLSNLETGAVARRQVAEKLDLAFRCETTHKVMELEVATEEDAYGRLTRRTRELGGLAALDEEGASNLALTIPPTLPTAKAGPQRIEPLAAGTFGGLFLGLAIAMLLQMLDRRLRYPETIERELGLRLLTVVPDVPALDPEREGRAA